MSFLRGLLSSPSEEQSHHGGVETIEKLCDRLETATLLDDRRDAIRALRALSKSFQVEVGTHAMDMLIKVIVEDSSDVEVTEMVIETLLNIMSSKGEVPTETDLGVQFTEIFVKSETNVTLLLSLLEEYEFHIRWPTVKLLILLLKNKSKELQERVLESPMGISKLMDLLSDSREVIRNDGLLLMIKLTRNNPAIQKIVAFENAFERLLLIVGSEGYSDGGIIVEDCLSLLLNLLRNNLSNQNFFRETSNIQRIAPFFEVEQGDEEEEESVWNVQKQTNIMLMLELLQVLICPTNNPQSVISCQKVMYTRGIYMQLMDFLLYPNLPTDIFAKMLLTIGDIIRGNDIIQQFMDELEISDRPAIVLILMFMVNEKQPFKVRLAALYCVQCFLFKNEKGQGSIVYTLLPNQEDVPSGVTSGQLLCAGLFSSDPVAHWLCSVTLAHCLYNNTTQHDNMLLVQLELTPGLPPVYLITQVFEMLVKEESQCTRFGTLMLLVHWVEECPAAVATLLESSSFIPYILELIENRDGEDAIKSLQSSLCALLLGACVKYNDNTSQKYNKATLLHLITHRIGVDNYSELLESACVKPYFTQASKSPRPTAAESGDLALDYCFTKFFKKQQDLIVRTLEGDEEVETENTIESHDLIVNSYKELIKEQDEEINKLKEELAARKPPADSAATEQLQQYTRDQEQYYQQYIAQLQAWYTEQLTQAQESGPLKDLEVRFEELRLAKQQQDQYVSQLVSELEVVKQANAAHYNVAPAELYPRTPTDPHTNLEQAEPHPIPAPEPPIQLEAVQRNIEDRDNLLLQLEQQILVLNHTQQQREAETEALKQKLVGTETELSLLKQRLLEAESVKDSVSRAGVETAQEKLVQSESECAALKAKLSESESECARLRVAGSVVIASGEHASQTFVPEEHTASQTFVPEEHTASQTAVLEGEHTASQTHVPEGAHTASQTTGLSEAHNSEETPQNATSDVTTTLHCDYSQWFTPVVADDGITYYQSTDGHIYTEEQYHYTIEQYEQYYRAQEQQQQEQQVEQQVEQQQEQQVEQQVEQDTQSNQVELLKEEIKNLRGALAGPTPLVDDTKQLSKSVISHYSIESTYKPCVRSEVKHIEILAAALTVEDSPTPDMLSTASEQTELIVLQEKYDSLATEQDDLLVLLALQDKKLASLKTRLRSLGDSVDSSESDDDFDDLLDSCEDLPKTSELTGDGRLASS